MSADRGGDDRGELGLRLLLASLGVLFLAGAVGYAAVRLRAPAGAGIDLPDAFWPATALLLAGGWALRRAAGTVPAAGPGPDRRRRWLAAALAAAVAFLAVQTPAMLALLRAHDRAATGGLHLYGLILFLVALHAAHVLGGLAPLALATAREAGPAAWPPRALGRLALYWRFLEAVWLLLFAELLVLG